MPGTINSPAITTPVQRAIGSYVQPVDWDDFISFLQAAANDALPMVVYTDETRTIPVYAGIVKRMDLTPSSVSIINLCSEFHLQKDTISNIQLVQKPTAYGLVTSIALWDAQENVIALFLSSRKPDKYTSCKWRVLIEKHLSP